MEASVALSAVAVPDQRCWLTLSVCRLDLYQGKIHRHLSLKMVYPFQMVSTGRNYGHQDPQFHKGYMNNPEKTALEASLVLMSAYHTGDVVAMTDEGLLSTVAVWTSDQV